MSNPSGTPGPETRFRWLADRGALCQQTGALFVTDLHLGKEATFQAHGVPLTDGGTGATLERLARMISREQPARVVILGDLFHARSSLTTFVKGQWSDFLDQFSQIPFTLVRGNHDRHSGPIPTADRLAIVDPPHTFADLTLLHEPAPATDEASWVLAGHTHPGIRIARGMAIEGTFPCFHWSSGCLTLPALGAYTRTSLVKRAEGDRVWAIIENVILEIPPTHKHRRPSSKL